MLQCNNMRNIEAAKPSVNIFVALHKKNFNCRYMEVFPAI